MTFRIRTVDQVADEIADRIAVTLDTAGLVASTRRTKVNRKPAEAPAIARDAAQALHNIADQLNRFADEGES